MDTGPILTPLERLSIMEDMGLGYRAIPSDKMPELLMRTNALAMRKALSGAIVGAPADPEAFG